MSNETNPEAPAPDGASSPQAEEQAQVVADIMAFDPFGPAQPAETGQSTDPGQIEGEGGESGGEGEETPEPKAVVAPAPTPQQQGPTQREQELLAQVAALQRVIQTTQPQGQQPQKAEQPAAKYNLGIPPQVIQGLRSEDEQEFAVAMHAVINGIANRLWLDVQDHLSREVMPQFDQRVSARLDHNTQARQVHDEFYSAYPHLKNPAVMPLVQNAALMVAQNWHAQGKPISWGKEFSDAVANYIHQIIPMPQQQQTEAQPKQRQPFTTRPGSRPAPVKGNEYGELL